MKLRTPALCAVIVLAGSACTPAEVDDWLAWWQDDPQEAEDYAHQDWVQRSLAWGCESYCDVDDPDMQGEDDSSSSSSSDESDSNDSQESEDEADGIGGYSCSQWYEAARDAGFSDDQWREPVSRIMAAESGCNPGAYNPSGASGLMQVMAGWADDCGGSPDDLFDPWFNLRCAHHVYEVQGWGAWVTY